MWGEIELRQLAQSQGNHISAAQAGSVGLSAIEFRRLTSTGRWTEVTDRVLRLAGAAEVRGERLHAAVLDQGGDAAVGGEAAAWWWDVPGFSPSDAILVTTSSTKRHTTLADVRQIRQIPGQWTSVFNSLRVVRPEFVILQLCATVHPLRAGRALDNAWRDRLLSGCSIDRFLADLGRRGRNGVTLLRELRDARPGDYIPPASNLESRAFEVLSPLGLKLVAQVDSGGLEHWTGRVDFRDARLPLVIEVQSEKYHSALLDREADQARRNAFERDGYEFVEITDVEVWSSPEVARQRVAAAVKKLRGRRAS